MAMLRFHITVTGFKVNTADKKVDILAFLPETSGSQSLQIINKDHQFLLQDIYLLPGNQVDAGKIFNIIHQIPGMSYYPLYDTHWLPGKPPLQSRC